MSGQPVSFSSDSEAASKLAHELVQVVIAGDCNVATLLTALALMTGDSIFNLERAGIQVTLDTAFEEMRRVAEIHLEGCRRRAVAQSLDCVGTA